MESVPQSHLDYSSQSVWKAYSLNDDTHWVSVSPEDISSESDDADCTSKSVWEASAELIILTVLLSIQKTFTDKYCTNNISYPLER